MNKNTIPYDPQRPGITSGIRLGTQAMTTRGMGLEDMVTVARYIHRGLQAVGDESALKTLKAEVAAFCASLPLPSWPISQAPSDSLLHHVSTWRLAARGGAALTPTRWWARWSFRAASSITSICVAR